MISLFCLYPKPCTATENKLSSLSNTTTFSLFWFWWQSRLTQLLSLSPSFSTGHGCGPAIHPAPLKTRNKSKLYWVYMQNRGNKMIQSGWARALAFTLYPATKTVHQAATDESRHATSLCLTACFNPSWTVMACEAVPHVQFISKERLQSTRLYFLAMLMWALWRFILRSLSTMIQREFLFLFFFIKSLNKLLESP